MSDHLGTPVSINLPTTSSVKLRGEDYAQVFEAELVGSRLAQGGGVSDKMRHDRTIELHRTMHKTKWEVATVINMHSFELRHGMGNIGELRIPKKKENEPYCKFTILKYRVSMRDLGDAKYVPEAVLPVQMAEDLCLMAKDWGGVFWYRGDGEPSPEELTQAYEAQLKFYEREYTKGFDIWNRTKQIHLITEHMKSAAKELFAIKRLKEMPEWVSLTRDEAQQKMCDACGNDIKAKAKMCSYCGFIIDPEFYQKNKDRFAAPSNQKREVPSNNPVDDTKKATEDFFRQDDPEALNQVKNLDSALASKLSEDMPTTQPINSTIQPLNTKKK